MGSKLGKIRILSSSRTKIPYAEIEYLGTTEPPGVGGYMNIYYPSGTGIFYGVIQNKKQIGQYHYLLEAKSHTYDLYRDFIDEDTLNSFSNTTISGAIHSLINAYYDTSNFKVSVDGGTDNISITFDDGIYVGEAIDTLCKIGNLNYSVKKDSDGKNHLYVYPNETTTSHTYSSNRIISISRFGESDQDYANYVMVKGGIGYNGKEYTHYSNDHETLVSDGFVFGNLIEKEYDKIYSISLYLRNHGTSDAEVTMSMYPVLTNLSAIGSPSGSLTSISNINDEDKITSGTEYIAPSNTSVFGINWSGNISLKKVGIDYKAPFDHQLEIKTYDSSGGVWTTNISSYIRSSSGHIVSFFDIVEDTNKLKVEITNKDSSSQFLNVYELMAFSPDFHSNHWYLPDFNNVVFENVKATLSGSASWKWVEFKPESIVDISRYKNFMIKSIVSIPSNYIGILNGGGNSSNKSLLTKVRNNIFSPDISKSYNIKVKWAGDISYSSGNATLINNEGRYPYIYKNTAINDYDIAKTMAEKLLDELSSSKEECTIVVPFQYAHDIEIGDKVYVDISQYNYSSSLIVKGYEHQITGKQAISKLHLGTDEFDPGIYLKKLITTMDNARTK